MPTLGPIRQNAGCHQLTRSGDWLFLNSHKVMGIKCSPGSHRKSRMSALPFFSLKMAQWHFQKGGTATTCQHRMGNTRLDAKREGYLPPGDWRCCQCSLILRTRASWESKETLPKRVWKRSWKKETMADNEKQPGKGRELALWGSMVLHLTPRPGACYSCNLRLTTLHFWPWNLP